MTLISILLQAQELGISLVKCVFLHSHLPEEETVYVHIPIGFARHNKHGNAKGLKLKICLYGLRNSPRQFWKFMVEKL